MNMIGLSSPWPLAALLLLAAALSLRGNRRQPRSHRLTHAAVLAGASAALFLFLHPPSALVPHDGRLVVLAPGATGEQLARYAAAERVIALPDVATPVHIPHWPDLASVLRRHDALLHVVGDGIPLRDRDAAHGRVVAFDAAPLPDGIIELSAAQAAPVGSIWRVTGRSHGDIARVALRDPAGAVIADRAVEGHGGFQFDATLRTAGPALFSLQAMAADGRVIDDIPLGVDVRPGESLRVHVLAAAPDAELKYLRRWAVDSGLDFSAQTGLSGSIALHEGDGGVDAGRLAELDILVVDERSWAALSAMQRQAIAQAVDQGLGVLLRVTGPLDADTRTDWQDWGIALDAGVAGTATLDSAATVPLQRQPWLLRRGAPLLRGMDGDAVAAWQAHGRGRVGMVWLEGAWPLVLAGESAGFGSVWARLLSMLARPGDMADITFSGMPRMGQRALACGMPATAQLTDPLGHSVALIADASGCAPFWPVRDGWHQLNINDLPRFIYVLSEMDAGPLLRARARVATLRMVDPDVGSTINVSARAMPRWPFFLGWVALMAGLWWLERRRETPESA